MIVAVDTEWARGKGWCLTFSVAPGTAWMIMADQTRELELFNELVTCPDVTTIIHNAMYDIPVLAQMGIHPRKVYDTMVIAYLLQNEPQGLKPLAFRHCGMTMNTYTETVAPAQYQMAMDYLDLVLMLEWPKPDPVLEWKDGQPKMKMPQRIERKVQSMLKKNPPDPWVKWKAMDGREIVEQKIGPMPVAEVCDIPFADALQYACRDADATLRVFPILWDRLESMGLVDTFERDMRAMPMVVDMQGNGMPVDIAKFQELSAYFQTQMDRLQAEIQKVAEPYIGDKQINPGSFVQMAELFYTHLRLQDQGGKHKSKKAKTNLSTSDDVIKRYVALHPVVQHLLDWRGYQKLKGTYADAIPPIAAADGRVRCTLRMTRTATGRLSSAEPNLMAQPVRSDEGLKIRECYVAPEGRVLLSGDFSQIEMRTAAHMAQDERMLKIFRDDLDIHAQTASWMFGIPIDQLDPREHRYPAKRIGFGVLYMLTAEGLKREMAVAGLDWSLQKCEDAIHSWFDVYSGISAFMKETGHYAKRYGYVKDMYGRIRYVPGIRSMNKWVRMDAERQAGNAPIQMGATGVMKEAMARLIPFYKPFGKSLFPCLPIHDDIVWEVDEPIVEDVVPSIKEIMEGAAPEGFSVPLKVDFKWGKSWGEQDKK